jgi:hypothetical protein
MSAFDQTFTAGPITNHPFGNQQTTYGADFDFDLLRRVDLRATAEHRRRAHSFREVEEDAENVVGLQANYRPIDRVALQAGYHYGDRELDEFHIEDYEDDTGALIEHPGLRRFDVADRFENQATAGVSLELTDRLALEGLFDFTQDRFPNSRYGLRMSIQRAASAEASYQLTDAVDVTGGYGRGRSRTEQRSNQSNPPIVSDPANDWSASIKDKNDFAFARMQWRPRSRLALTLDYLFSRALSEFHLSNSAGTAQDLPNTFYRRHNLDLEARYRVLERTELAARYGFDQYDITDFASEDIALLGLTAGAATAIYLGDNSQDYHAHIIALVATRRF